jgi:hypothetical protein
MGKKSRTKRFKRNSTDMNYPMFTHMDKDGFHALIPGVPPSENEIEEITKKYQENIRNSPLWGEMLRKFGKEKAEELLLQCRFEIKK